MHRARSFANAIAIVAAMLCATSEAAQYGNDSAANARPILADGTAYTDQLAPMSTDAWFTFRVDPQQSYAIDVWMPYGRASDGNNAVGIWALLESDGVSAIATTDRSLDFPAPQLESGFSQGERRTFVNTAAARRLVLRVLNPTASPTVAHSFAVRVVPTTMAAARWSVNGYSDIFALSNVAASDAFSSHVSGTIVYFDEAGSVVGSDNFTLPPNGSVQIIKPNGVALGGATRGGVRIVHDGAPGAILAQQTWFNPVTGQFVHYPFTTLVHAYSRGSL